MALARRAVTVRERSGVASERLAEARFMLARALWDAPAAGRRDRAQAIALAEQARDAWRTAGAGWIDELATVERWLDEHARAR
jgi:hypothetical protein